MASITPTQLPDTGGGLAQDLGWAIRALSMAFQQRAIAAVEAIPGGPRGYLVLVAVSKGDAGSQLSLAQSLSIDKTQMTYLLDTLEREGLLVRVPSATDRRVRLIRITDAGRAVAESARIAVAAAEEAVLSALSPAEAEQLRALLARAAQGVAGTTDLC